MFFFFCLRNQVLQDNVNNMNITNGQAWKNTQKESEKKLCAFFQLNQTALSIVNLTYYTKMVGNLLRKAEAGLNKKKKRNTAFPSHIYENKSKLMLFLFLPQEPHFLTVLRLTTSLSECVARHCTQNNTLWLHSLVGLAKLPQNFWCRALSHCCGIDWSTAIWAGGTHIGLKSHAWVCK